MPPLSISVLIATRDRPQELQRCLDTVLAQCLAPQEILLLDDGPVTPVPASLLTTIRNTVRLHYQYQNPAIGVAAGRNMLMQNAQGDLLVILDDDAYFADNEVLERIATAFASLDSLGILALSIQDFRYTPPRMLKPNASPHRLGAMVMGAGYFIGGAHVIRKDVALVCAYSPELRYAHEELELSYQCIDAGFSIGLLDGTAAIHRPSSNTAFTEDPTRFYGHVRNRIWLARSYLPLPFFATHLAAWLVRYAFRAFKYRLWRTYFSGVRDGFRMQKQRQEKIGTETIRYLKTHRGRLWW